jgi:hypothetical protein
MKKRNHVDSSIRYSAIWLKGERKTTKPHLGWFERFYETIEGMRNKLHEITPK